MLAHCGGLMMQKTITRRAIIGGLVAAGGIGIAGGYFMSRSGTYDQLLAEQMRPLADDPDVVDLVRYATLAANSHNTQPWIFRAGAGGIDVLPDASRRTPVVDPDDHHLYASLGCAAENLSIAAKARGLSGDVQFAAEGETGRLRVVLDPASREESGLFAAIPIRQCARAVYDGSAIGNELMTRLEASARIDGVEPIFVTDPAQRERILDLVVAGNNAQLDDPAFMAELKFWLRFNEGALAASRDGLFSAASGNPTFPSWLGPLMFDLFITKDGEKTKLAKQMRSSPGLVVLVAPTDDKAGWVATGRACQRFALQATIDGLKHAFVNQAVEVPTVRRELQSLLGVGDRRPSLLVRFGNGPNMPRSLRRDARDVLLTS
jgi:hypothetical protein